MCSSDPAAQAVASVIACAGVQPDWGPWRGGYRGEPRSLMSQAPATPAAVLPCPKGHALEEKAVAGTSWVAAAKTCSVCSAQLKRGMRRHSCKACKYHVCATCHPAVMLQWLETEITLTVYRAAQQGVEEDALQVRISRGASIGELQTQLSDLYGIPPQMQVLRRDVDSAPLRPEETLVCEDGDVLHLVVNGAANPLAANPFGALQEALVGAMQQAAAADQALLDALANTNYRLTFVMPASGASPEKRCQLEVSAVAHVAEVLDMVRLELDAEDTACELEFAGEVLPRPLQMHSAGLQDGDTVIVRSDAECT